MRRILLTVSCLAFVASSAAAQNPVTHRLLASDPSPDKQRLAIINAKGEVEWEYPLGRQECHDLCMLPNGNVMFISGRAAVSEVSPDKKVVWKYESKPAPGGSGQVEIHGFQRLDDGLTMIAEGGNHRLIEVDKDGKIVKTVPLTIDRPGSHRDTRRARKLANGHYLVCHEGDGTVREYDADGKVVWSYKLDLAGRPRTPNHDGHGVEVFGAVRLPNGNTLITGGNNNRVLEINPKGEIVWGINHDDLPGIKLCWLTSLNVLPNGNIVFGNSHAGSDNPQLIEVTRDKKVVWTFKDFKTFGNNLCSAQILDVPGMIK